ncbi:MAG: outer membrane beta-barrel protein [Leadbetterella sp.]|nr:outer membrane beta-barrel protein [Leadbetterella sp.]
MFTVSGLFGSEKIIDRGDQPFSNASLSQRLWQFLEDELKTTVMGTAAYHRKFTQAGHVLNMGFNYTQPFPNLRLAYEVNPHHKLSLFYNRRVDRPNEADIRIFPKYEDAELIKVGNPELGHKYPPGEGRLPLQHGPGAEKARQGSAVYSRNYQ